MAVRQHAEDPHRYVVLTPHAVQVFVKLRPVDVLRRILRESRGADTEALRTFFEVMREEQGCATCLIVASQDEDDDGEVADYATRAFFVFGGEPRLATGNATNICEFFVGTVRIV